jgi:hypothetical protein
MPDISTILAEREKTHGEFARVADCYVAFKAVAIDHGQELEPMQSCALDMIFMKLARVLCGDPYFPDHFDDIEGYARLARLHTPTDADVTRMGGE